MIAELTIVISGVQTAQRFVRPSERSERLDHFVRQRFVSLSPASAGPQLWKWDDNCAFLRQEPSPLPEELA